MAPHRILLGAMLLTLGAYSLTVLAWPGATPRLLSIPYLLVQLAAGVACLWRARTVRRERFAWTAAAVGILAFSAGDVYWNLQVVGSGQPPFPSPADAGYLIFPIAVYLCGVSLLRLRLGRLPASEWLDGAIAGLAVAALVAELVFDRALSFSGDLATVAVTLAYPLGDLALLALAVGGFVLTGGRPGRGWMLFSAGLAAFTVADGMFFLQALDGSYVENSLVDCGWLAGMALIACAAWQPHGAVRRSRSDWATFALPVGSGVLCLGLETYDHFVRIGHLPIVLASTCLALIILRLALSFRENLAALRSSREQAFADALTGLGNRRALLRDLEDTLAADGEGALLATFDLDGFKLYNDSFGHVAGDALLHRLGVALSSAVDGAGRAYRMGGDEFCVLLAPVDARIPGRLEAAASALCEQGGFLRRSLLARHRAAARRGGRAGAGAAHRRRTDVLRQGAGPVVPSAAGSDRALARAGRAPRVPDTLGRGPRRARVADRGAARRLRRRAGADAADRARAPGHPIVIAMSNGLGPE